MLKQDYHIHSELSPDSTASLDGICEQAFRLGLEEVALTDHYEMIEGVTPRGSIRKEYLALTREKILDCRSRWEGRIRVVFGIELGQIHRQPEAAAQILAAHPGGVCISAEILYPRCGGVRCEGVMKGSGGRQPNVLVAAFRNLKERDFDGRRKTT